MDTAVALRGGLVQGARTSVTPARPKTAALPLTPERLVESYADTILRVSYTYLHNRADAEDICQEVLLKALAQEQPFRSESHERAWIIRVAINLCKDQLRRAASRQQVALEDAPEPAAPPAQAEVEAHAAQSRVLDAVMALPQDMRIAIYLHYYEGYPIRVISAITGASEAAIAKRLSRARAQLREMLKGDDDVFDFA